MLRTTAASVEPVRCNRGYMPVDWLEKHTWSPSDEERERSIAPRLTPEEQQIHRLRQPAQYQPEPENLAPARVARLRYV